MPNLTASQPVGESANIRIHRYHALREEGEGRYDRIHGFRLGIDDYVVKPFFAKELMMHGRRDSQTERRCSGEQDVVKIKEIWRWILPDAVSRFPENRWNDAKKYDLFLHGGAEQGIALTRKDSSQSSGAMIFGDDRTLDTHIKLLKRKSLGDYSKCIVTLRGVGYRFEGA